MQLSARDRAFLLDIAGTNYMHHLVATMALLGAGATPSSESESDAAPADQIRNQHNRPENLSFWSREPIPQENDLGARVQAMATLRIAQEYVAAMETTGALLRAIRDRARGGGVMRLNHSYVVGDVRAFFAEVRASRRTMLGSLLNWPGPAKIARRGTAELTARAHRTYPKIHAWLTRLADMYVKGTGFRLVHFNRMPKDCDPRSRTYVFVYVLGEGERRSKLRKSMIVHAFNKLKHGFNATADFEMYRRHLGARRGIVALEIPKRMHTVNTLGQQVDLLGTLCREAARFTLDFDQAGLL
jgi:hypothetical protein